MGDKYSAIDSASVEILSEEQLEPGTCNDNPLAVFRVRLPDGETGWIAGPHGVSECAIHGWLRNVGQTADTREDAIQIGCSDL